MAYKFEDLEAWQWSLEVIGPTKLQTDFPTTNSTASRLRSAFGWRLPRPTLRLDNETQALNLPLDEYIW